MKSIAVRGLKIGEGMPKICVPIVGRTKEEILEMAQQVQNVPADLVEWRADWYEAGEDALGVIEMLNELRTVLGEIPVIFTFRTKAEGGEKELDFEAYQHLLEQVATTKRADLIDVEVFKDNQVFDLIQMIQSQGSKVIGSNHDFQKTPSKEEMICKLCHIQSMGADVLKLAVMPQNDKDVQLLIEASKEMVANHAERPIVTMAMSEIGVVSRVTGESFGSSITFGTMGKSSAPGQIPAEELKRRMEMSHRMENA